MVSSDHQIFANPYFLSNPQKTAAPLGAGYPKYQPEVIFLELLGGQNFLVVHLLWNSNITQVSPN